MRLLIVVLTCSVLSISCVKNITDEPLKLKEPLQQFSTYKIAKGEHYANNDSITFTVTNYFELKFIARFDSSAIYSTITPSYQSDINKLYGFADNNMFHQKYSARFGWNWLKDGLHLWAYNYNESILNFEDLGIVPIGSDINCSIKVLPANYIFSVNGKETVMIRTSPTALGSGYKLFPYFGGHEPAPHDITILIKEL